MTKLKKRYCRHQWIVKNEPNRKSKDLVHARCIGCGMEKTMTFSDRRLEMVTSCDTCLHSDSIISKNSTEVCARCCAFNSWKPNTEQSPDANVEAIRNKLLERSKVGLEKYDVTTERNDLSLAQWLTHLQEELLDAAVYIEAGLNKHNLMKLALEDLMSKCRNESYRPHYQDLIKLYGLVFENEN